MRVAANNDFRAAQESGKVRTLRGFPEIRTLVFQAHPTTTFPPKWAELPVRGRVYGQGRRLGPAIRFRV